MNSWLLNLFCLGGPQINAKADESKITSSQAENLRSTGRLYNQALILRPSFVPEKSERKYKMIFP
jgi:hypothetical protein